MKRHGKSPVWVPAVGMITVLALVVGLLWWRDRSAAPPAPDEAAETTTGATSPQPGDAAPQPLPQPQPTPEPAPEAPPADPPASAGAEAVAALYRQGVAAYNANKLIEARTAMSDAYFSGLLSAELRSQARARLQELAEITLIGAGSSVFADDRYTVSYRCQPGDILAKLERRLKLHVPGQLILRINFLQRPEDLAAGRQYKMVYGPFHAIIYKSDLVMDVYLQREGLPKVFVKRLPIGTGKNGSTPVGMWRVKLGGKHERPTWYPPPNSEFRHPISYGQPDYAFGAKGLWIGMEGLDENTAPLTDYGLHSTNDQASIGKAESLGCIRLADDDIELVYSLLYEHWSTVEVRP